MTQQILSSDIFQAIENWAPKSLAYDWDPIGLQIGSHQKSVEKVMITLDVSEAVVDEAIEKEIDVIIAHHPFLFSPLKEINIDTPRGSLIQKLIKENITVYAAHTNLDIAPDGVNDMLCDQLQIEPDDFIIHQKTGKLYKLAVYVPETNVEELRNVLSEAGAGFIGKYSHCTFQSKGEGTFKPQQGTSPHIGEIDKLTYVDEYKLETVVKEEELHSVVEKMITAHPYEEVAYDVYPLFNKGERFGLGRIGSLSKQLTLKQFTEEVKQAFMLDHVRVVGSLQKNIKKVAIIGGSGEKYIHQAKQKGADVLITGDMTFHPSQEAEEIGLAVIDAGHYIEEVMKEATKNKLQEVFKGEAVDWIVSTTNTDPFQWI